MADNVTAYRDDTTQNDAIATFAADDIGSVMYPRTKVGFGVDGSYTDASATNPLPIVPTLAALATATTGNITTADVSSNALPPTTGSYVECTLPTGCPQVLLSNRGTYGTFDWVYEVYDGISWYGTRGSNVGSATPFADSGGSPSANSSNTIVCYTNGRTQFRVRATSFTSGTSAVTIQPLVTPLVTTQSVAQLTPGTYPTSLGKAEGAAVSAGQTGVAMLVEGSTGNHSTPLLDSDRNLKVIASGAATLAEQQSQTASLGVIDDWDESDRCKVNLIVGQVGIAAGSGSVSATTQRVVLATDVSLPAGTNAIGKLTANSGVTIGSVEIAAAQTIGLSAGAAAIGTVGVTSVVPGTTSTALGKAEDSAHTSGDTGVLMLGVRNSSVTTFTDTDGDYSPLAVNLRGELLVGSITGPITAGTAATSLGKAEDAVHASGDTGVFVLVVRSDTPASTAGTTGDYTALIADSSGKLWVACDSAVAHDAADSGNPAKMGAKATASLKGLTMVADNDRTNLHAGVDGVQIVRNFCNLEDAASDRLVNTDGASTAFSGAFAATASQFIRVTNITIANSSSAFCTVDVRDGTAGSVLWTLPVPANSGISQSFDPPLKLSVNTALAIDASAAISTLTISALGFKSKI